MNIKLIKKLKNYTLKQKILIVCMVIFLLIITISIIFVIFYNNKNTQSSIKIEQTGGDYSEENKVYITNSGNLYKYMSTNSTNNVISFINKSIICNKSLSNDQSISSEYTKITDIDSYTCTPIKQNQIYIATIDDDCKISSINNTAWYYSLSITIDDNRHFTVIMNVNPDNDNDIISVKKD